MNAKTTPHRSNWLLSLVAAILPPTCLPTIYFGALDLTSPYPNGTTIFLIAIVAFAVSAGHVILLGAPGVIFLRKIRKLTGLSICVMGFLTGCIPMAFWSWPLQYSLRGASEIHWDGEKMVSSMVDGVPTLARWISYTEGVATMGAFGVASALAFWLVWRRSGAIHQC